MVDYEYPFAGLLVTQEIPYPSDTKAERGVPPLFIFEKAYLI
jgi:hypothetical protein